MCGIFMCIAPQRVKILYFQYCKLMTKEASQDVGTLKLFKQNKTLTPPKQ